MGTEKLNKKEARKEAKILLAKGMDKKLVFQEMNAKYNQPKELRSILEYLPTQEAFTKYGKWNMVLLVLVSITGILLFVGSASILIALLFALFIFVISNQLIRFYRWVSVFGFIMLFSFVFIIFSNDAGAANWGLNVLTILLFAVLVVMPFWLTEKLCPERKNMETW